MECSSCHAKIEPAKTVSRAYDTRRSGVSSKTRALNVLLVAGDCILVGLQPVLVYMSKVDGGFKFSPVSVNFLTEVTKVFFALLMLCFHARRPKEGDRSLLSLSAISQAARNNLLLAVPAFLYAINNYLKFVMQVPLFSFYFLFVVRYSYLIRAICLFLISSCSCLQLYFNPATVKMLSNLKVLSSFRFYLVALFSADTTCRF